MEHREKIQKLEEALNAAASKKKADILIYKDRLLLQATEAAVDRLWQDNALLREKISSLEMKLREESISLENNASLAANDTAAFQLEREAMAAENIDLHNQLHAANEAITVELSEKKELQERCTELTDENEAGSQRMVANCDT